LTVHQPSNISSISEILSHTGTVTVHGSENFQGYFEAGTHVGKISVATGENKEIKVIEEEMTEVGGLLRGLIKFRGNETEGLVEVEGRDEDDSEESSPPPPGKGPGGPPPPTSQGSRRSSTPSTSQGPRWSG